MTVLICYEILKGPIVCLSRPCMSDMNGTKTTQVYFILIRKNGKTV